MLCYRVVEEWFSFDLSDQTCKMFLEMQPWVTAFLKHYISNLRYRLPTLFTTCDLQKKNQANFLGTALKTQLLFKILKTHLRILPS